MRISSFDRTVELDSGGGVNEIVIPRRTVTAFKRPCLHSLQRQRVTADLVIALKILTGLPNAYCAYIRAHSNVSGAISNDCGVLQGAVLSPFFFTLHASNIFSKSLASFLKTQITSLLATSVGILGYSHY